MTLGACPLASTQSPNENHKSDIKTFSILRFIAAISVKSHPFRSSHNDFSPPPSSRSDSIFGTNHFSARVQSYHTKSTSLLNCQALERVITVGSSGSRTFLLKPERQKPQYHRWRLRPPRPIRLSSQYIFYCGFLDLANSIQKNNTRAMKTRPADCLIEDRELTKDCPANSRNIQTRINVDCLQWGTSANTLHKPKRFAKKAPL